MGWASRAIAELQAGRTVDIRPRGKSMSGKVEDGDLVTVAPCDPKSLVVDDIVLVRVGGREYLHLVKARDGERIQIGNNKGHVNGWVGPAAVYGKAIRVSR